MPGFAPETPVPPLHPSGVDSAVFAERAGVYARPRRTRTASPLPAPRLSWAAAARGPRGVFVPNEDLRRHPAGPRAQLAARRRRGQDPRPPGDPDRRRPARQAQADLHAARRRRRLRGRRQRREDRRDRQQARGEALLPPLRLPRRPQVAHAQRDARAPARGGHPPRREGHAAPQPPGPQADHEAQGLRRAGPSARRADARRSWRSRPDGQRTSRARTEQGEVDEPEEIAAEDAVGAAGAADRAPAGARAGDRRRARRRVRAADRRGDQPPPAAGPGCETAPAEPRGRGRPPRTRAAEPPPRDRRRRRQGRRRGRGADAARQARDPRRRPRGRHRARGRGRPAPRRGGLRGARRRARRGAAGEAAASARRTSPSRSPTPPSTSPPARATPRPASARPPSRA